MGEPAASSSVHLTVLEETFFVQQAKFSIATKHAPSIFEPDKCITRLRFGYGLGNSELKKRFTTPQSGPAIREIPGTLHRCLGLVLWTFKEHAFVRSPQAANCSINALLELSKVPSRKKIQTTKL